MKGRIRTPQPVRLGGGALPSSTAPPEPKRCPPGTNHKPDLCDWCALEYLRDQQERKQP